jgi:hypothetical protein
MVRCRWLVTGLLGLTIYIYRTLYACKHYENSALDKTGLGAARETRIVKRLIVNGGVRLSVPRP